MNDITITNIETKYINIYQSFFQSITKYNKYFDVTDKDIYLVNNGSVDIGVILLKKDFYNLIVEIYQAPRVCRLSIISLIECSALVAKQVVNESFLTATFKLNNAASYNFKFKTLFKEFIELEDSIQISSELLKETTEDQITFRNITFTVF